MTDININVDLGVDQALLDKLKKQRAESRQQERPFVPKTIADSSVLPNQETRAGSTGFSTNIYTSNQSLSRNRDTTGIVPVATSSFSRQTFTQAYNQAQVRTVDAQGRKRYYDPELRIWVDEPNRLLSRKITDNSWYLLWDYVKGSGYPSRFTFSAYELADAPVAFFGGTEIDNAIVNNPKELDKDGDNIGPADTELRWISTTAEVRTAASGPFGTYVVLDDPVLYPEADPTLPFYQNGIAVEAIFNTDVYQYTEFSEAGKPILTGTLEADFWFDADNPGDNSYFQVWFYNADQNRYAVFRLGIQFTYPEDTSETGTPIVNLGASPATDTADFDDYRVRKVIPSAPARWYRLSFTMDTDICYAHLDGEYIGSCLPGYQPTSTSGEFFMRAGTDNLRAFSEVMPNRLGRCRFTDAILYDNTSYVVEAIG